MQLGLAVACLVLAWKRATVQRSCKAVFAAPTHHFWKDSTPNPMSSLPSPRDRRPVASAAVFRTLHSGPKKARSSSWWILLAMAWHSFGTHISVPIGIQWRHGMSNMSFRNPDGRMAMGRLTLDHQTCDNDADCWQTSPKNLVQRYWSLPTVSRIADPLHQRSPAWSVPFNPWLVSETTSPHENAHLWVPIRSKLVD